MFGEATNPGASAILLTALRLIRDTRDIVANGGTPPWDAATASFDDWAADVADAAIAAVAPAHTPQEATV